MNDEKPVILIVEDNEDIIEMEKIMFEREGYAVTAETDPLTAVETFRRNPDEFDLIVTDFAMPRMTGLEFSQAARAIRPSIPIMLLTGHWNPIPGYTARALNLAVAHKPIGMRELREWVRRLIAGCGDLPADR